MMTINATLIQERQLRDLQEECGIPDYTDPDWDRYYRGLERIFGRYLAGRMRREPFRLDTAWNARRRTRPIGP